MIYRRTDKQNCNKTQSQLSELWAKFSKTEKVIPFLYRGLVFEERIIFTVSGRFFQLGKTCLKLDEENEFYLDEKTLENWVCPFYVDCEELGYNISVNDTYKIKEAKSQLTLSNLWEKYISQVDIIDTRPEGLDGFMFIFTDNGNKITLDKYANFMNEKELRFSNDNKNGLAFSIQKSSKAPYICGNISKKELLNFFEFVNYFGGSSLPKFYLGAFAKALKDLRIIKKDKILL